ncbi:MAG: butyrate kinase [Desulfitobacteriia bacterium]|jgi:butyrate kinase
MVNRWFGVGQFLSGAMGQLYPGGDTKLISTKTLHHDPEVILKYNSIVDQVPMRLQAIEKFMEEQSVSLDNLEAVVGRGGFLDPIESGAYLVNEKMLIHLTTAKNGEHASNLGAILAQSLADKKGLNAYVVDPPSVDELSKLARYSGLPELPRHSILHALNIRRVALNIAGKIGKKIEDCNFVVTHLGGGVSVCAMSKGKMIDVNNANNGGPFSPERAGGLPAGDLIRLCFSSKFSEGDLRRKIIGQGGLVGYLGTNNGVEIEKRIEKGDERARQVYMALGYQVVKEIGAMATILKLVDGLIFTGGLAYSKFLIEYIKSYISFIAPIYLIPGENELVALSEGVTRVLQGLEEVKIY